VKAWWNAETCRYPLAVLGGLLWALAFPLPGWAGLAWIAPGILLFSSIGLVPAAAFRFGYVAGAVHFFVLLRWMRHMPVGISAWAAWGSLAAYCALYPAVWAWLASRWFQALPTAPDVAPGSPREPADIASQPVGEWVRAWWLAGQRYVRAPWIRRASLLAALAMAWVALEWLRGILLTGFPWCPLGVSQWRQAPLIQIAGVGGVHAVSFLVVWVSLALVGATVMLALRAENRWTWVAEARVPLLLLLCLMGWGFWSIMAQRKLEARTKPATYTMALVQPSIAQTLLWDPAAESSNFQTIEGLSRQALALKPDALVWPEGSFGLTPTNFGRMTTLTREAGVPWVFAEVDQAGDAQGVHSYNAAFLFGADGRFAQVYRKRRLVIFGEYVPLARWLPFLRWLTPIQGGFHAGTEPVAFRLTTNVATAPVICFEDTFPHGLRDHVRADTDFILELTNDAWFRESAAQWQHQANAVFRAVENGVPLVRVTNNGVTGWFDACGIPRDILNDGGNVYAPGVLLVSVPVGMPRAQTPYQRHGDLFAGLCAAFTALRLAASFRKPSTAA
jgi:apolipoprotein N-acyltransferase